VQELNAQATLVDASGIDGGLTTTIARSEIEDALKDEAPPQLDLDVRRGEDAQTVAIKWSRDDLKRLLGEATSEHITLTFDRGTIEQAFSDVEGHGLGGKAAVIAVAVAAAAGFAGGASGMPMGESSGPAVSAARVADPTSGGVDPWQFNLAESAGTAAAANPKAGMDPWQYNVGTSDQAARQAAADPKAGQDPWQYNLGTSDESAPAANPKSGQDPWAYNLGTSDASSPAVAASSDGTSLGDLGGAAAAGGAAVLLIAGAAFVTANRRRIPAT
jgi:hypothetical protein